MYSQFSCLKPEAPIPCPARGVSRGVGNGACKAACAGVVWLASVVGRTDEGLWNGRLGRVLEAVGGRGGRAVAFICDTFGCLNSGAHSLTGAYGVFGFLGDSGVDSSSEEETSLRPTLRFAIAGAPRSEPFSAGENLMYSRSYIH